MKNQLQRFQKAVHKARHQLATAQALFNRLKSEAKAAKAKSRQLKLDYKRQRADAREAKRLALGAQEKVQQKTKALARASRRLEKTLKKFGKKAAAPKLRAAAPRRTTSGSARARRSESRGLVVPSSPAFPPKPGSLRTGSNPGHQPSAGI